MYNISYKSKSTLDKDYITNLVYPNMDLFKGIVPEQYNLMEPYRLVFSTQNLDEETGFFSNCFVSPSDVIYSSLTNEEFLPLYKSLRLHRHDFFELMFVLDGEIYVNVENQRHLYTKGSCCILNRNIMHSEEYNSNYSIVFLQISSKLMESIYSDMLLNFFECENAPIASDMYDFLKSNLSDAKYDKDYVDFIPEKNVDYLESTVHQYFDQITRETLSPSIGSSVRIKNIIIELLYFLLSPDNFSTTPLQVGSDAESALFNSIFRAMKESDGRISRSQLAAKLNYSGSYLNRVCKKRSGLTLFDYGMTFTMKKAAELLKSTTANIYDIETSLGFSNHTHFYKLFKKTYGMTPAEYRKSFLR